VAGVRKPFASRLSRKNPDHVLDEHFARKPRTGPQTCLFRSGLLEGCPRVFGCGQALVQTCGRVRPLRRTFRDGDFAGSCQPPEVAEFGGISEFASVRPLVSRVLWRSVPSPFLGFLGSAVSDWGGSVGNWSGLERAKLRSTKRQGCPRAGAVFSSVAAETSYTGSSHHLGITRTYSLIPTWIR